MNRKIIIPACVALAACACNNGGQVKEQEPSGAASAPSYVAAVPTVSVQPAARETVVLDEVYSATVQANAVNNIAPQSASRIQSIKVDVGDFVSAGQVVAEMDKLQLQQAELRLNNEKTEFERLKGLYEEGGISQSDFEARELSLKVNQSTYDNLLENTVLRSPVSGVITARNYDKGDLYAMAQPLFVVQQITPVKILVGVSEADYTKVKKGDKAAITVDALPGKSFTGSVYRIYPMMDAASHTFNVELRVPNADRALRPGMYARVNLTFGTNESVVVPDVAVVKQQGSGQRSVFVLCEDGTVSMRTVTLGRHFDSKYEILSGIAEGESVVVKGQATLKNGEKVEVLK